MRPLTGRELRRLEPALGPEVPAACRCPTTRRDNRRLLAALAAAAERAGVVVSDRGVARVLDDGARVTGVRLADGVTVAADAVVVAAGAHSSSLHPVLDGLVRPVKARSCG
ncbi:FAD-dependent oxidoreductase [Pseudonocardia sp. ICBG601]|uniref:FAD-dependent oxidoreductase n=1 Tax=Pseudonocardia sp. ICBG601 TaxID=2846759 RepID=UPI0027E2261D|nr:FAD-dependent oxidoreductase [Pseudonocardia sp. ICBG601]